MPGVVDRLGGLRVGPDVELGGRGHVALGGGTPHRDDPLDVGATGALEQQRDVGQRAGRHQRDGRGLAAIVRSRKSTACSPSGSCRAGGSVGPSRPLSPWTCEATVSSRASGRSAPAATGMSVRPARSSTRSAFAVVFSSVWLPWTVVTPRTSTSGLASASSSAIASSCPGSQSRMIGMRHARSIAIVAAADFVLNQHKVAQRAEDRVDLGSGRERRLGAEPGGGEGAGGAGAGQRLLLVAPFEQRDEQARGEGVARRSAVDHLDLRRGRPRHLLAVLEQDGSLGAERQRHEAVGARERLELEAVDDGEVGVDGDPPRGRGVEAEHPGRLLPRRERPPRPGSPAGRAPRPTARARSRPRRRVRSGRDDDRRLAGGVDGDQGDAGRLVGLAHVELDPCLAQPRERLVRERVTADRSDERDPGAEPRAGDGLVRTLAAREPRERRTAHGLAGTRQLLTAHDEVEVDRADDGDAGGGHGHEAYCG